MTTGILILAGKKKTLQVKFTNANGKEVTSNIKESELSDAIAQNKRTNIDSLNNLEVEFEEVKGQPTKIREKGQSWEVSTARPTVRPSSSNPPQNQRNRQSIPQSLATARQLEPEVTHSRDFHNPYNFIPALPRENLDFGLKDGEPVGHDHYHDNLWSGRIAVTLTTVTPLLIPDAAKATEVEGTADHYSYPLRRVDGKPYLPPTSIKGMLRSAYEAVTNSRFSIFNHPDRLAYRMEARNYQPARVETNVEGKLVLKVLKPAKLRRYQARGEIADDAIRYPNGELPEHGDAVWVRINQHWRVTAIKLRIDGSDGEGWRAGWACVTGANVNNKRHERVFIESQDELISIGQNEKDLWSELIRNYQETHVKDLEARHRANQTPQDYLGDEPGRTAWSRHIWDKNEIELEPGRLCYVERDRGSIVGLMPVAISRRLYKLSPATLLPVELKPATALDQLSPADRVFGWVNQQGKGAYRGQLRIGTVNCVSDYAVEYFDNPGLPVAILGQPQPQQFRFYVAKNRNGESLPNKTLKDNGYESGYGLRGRKVYPHHQTLDEREYRRQLHNGQDKDNQNRSIQAWVKPDVEFKFNIDVVNLSGVELGALLWLLNLPESCYHRLGGGKPLGFGSVKLTVDWQSTDLCLGEEWREFYSSLFPPTKPDATLAIRTIEKFEEAIASSYNSDFLKVSFITAFLQAAKGFEDGKPIHYPRTTAEPNPAGEGFEWFVDNERTDGFKLSLPHLTKDSCLPLNPTTSQ